MTWVWGARRAHQQHLGALRPNRVLVGAAVVIVVRVADPPLAYYSNSDTAKSLLRVSCSGATDWPQIECDSHQLAVHTDLRFTVPRNMQRRDLPAVVE